MALCDNKTQRRQATAVGSRWLPTKVSVHGIRVITLTKKRKWKNKEPQIDDRNRRNGKYRRFVSALRTSSFYDSIRPSAVPCSSICGSMGSSAKRP